MHNLHSYFTFKKSKRRLPVPPFQISV